MGLVAPTRGLSQSEEAQQLLLNFEKLNQLKQILADMKAGYQIVSKGYTTIRDLSQGNFSLHETFLDGLLAVSPAVRKYRRVADIIAYQQRLVREYQTAFARFRRDPHLTREEIAYLDRVYTHLFKLSLRHLDELLTVITASRLRMSDEERLRAIDRLFARTEDGLTFLRQFNSSTGMLAAQRARAQSDIHRTQSLHGLQP
jgi:hypothetical protein